MPVQITIGRYFEKKKGMTKDKIFLHLKQNAAGLSLAFSFAAVYIADAIAGGALFDALCSHPWEQNAMQLWRYFTFAFLHESVLHLIVNIFAIIAVCSLVEKEIGAIRVVSFWIFGSVFGESVFSVCATFQNGCGASLGIFALLAALCSVWLRYPKRFTMKWYRFDLYYLLMYLLAANFDRLAMIEHAFGFLFGMILSVLLILIRKSVKPHKMNLQPDPFNKIKSGRKSIELRLYDDKRRRIAVGDEIEFTCTDGGEKLTATVTDLHKFGSFKELYAALPLSKCGYTAEELQTASYSDMYAYYTAEEEQKYGVVGIEIKTL